MFFCLRTISEYERAVLFRLGKLRKRKTIRGPGLLFLLPCVDYIKRVDLRTITFDIPPQEVLTKDSVSVAVDAVVYYRIFQPIVSIVNIKDVNKSTHILAQTTLRNVLGTKRLSEILLDREEIAVLMHECLDHATDRWGVKVERVEIKDVRLPLQLQRVMAVEAEASREARAKVIMAEGEKKSAIALKMASDILQVAPYAIHLRYLLALSSISSDKCDVIIIPIPINIFFDKNKDYI